LAARRFAVWRRGGGEFQSKIQGHEVSVLARFIFWPWFAGLILLVTGLFTRRRALARARGLDVVVLLGPVFMAASIAVFGGEHLVRPRALMQLVPLWMPARLFWAYFVGVALLAAGVSIVLMKFVRLSAWLLGLMFLLFVLMIHVPNVAANPRDRFLWAIALREIAFAGGAWALAAGRVALGARFMVAVPLAFFGIEHLLHPTFVPGVPLNKLMPAWVAARAMWGYLTGAILLGGGMWLLATKRSRMAAVGVGLVLTLITLFLYVPILAKAVRRRRCLKI
jgi:uncharacterized membrane protein